VWNRSLLVGWVMEVSPQPLIYPAKEKGELELIENLATFGAVMVVDEIATMGMFLFSEAATWITGQIFVSPSSPRGLYQHLPLLPSISTTRAHRKNHS